MEAALKGLNGGHSGDDINKKRANAIKLLARFLFLENEKLGGELRLVSFNSGKMHNAILVTARLSSLSRMKLKSRYVLIGTSSLLK